MVIIGGGETGVAAALRALERSARRIIVFDGGAPWDPAAAATLSPTTRRLLLRALEGGRVELIAEHAVRIQRRNRTHFVVSGANGSLRTSSARPILAAGYDGRADVVAELLAWRRGEPPSLTAQDESTLTPGLFLVGPAVQHRVRFDSIHAFRTRFPVVATAIADRLGVPSDRRDGLQAYRDNAFWVEVRGG